MGGPIGVPRGEEVGEVRGGPARRSSGNSLRPADVGGAVGAWRWRLTGGPGRTVLCGYIG
jgi:hypothetical protein